MKLTNFDYRHRIEELVELAVNGTISPQMGVVAQGLMTSTPAPEAVFSEANMSSDDLVALFAPLCDISNNEVAEVMLALGYKVYLDPLDGPMWAFAETKADNKFDD